MTRRHEIAVGDGAVVAVHHPHPNDQWFVCSHGLRSDKSGSYESRCERAVAAGYNAVRFDHRGCGASSGAFPASTLDARIADLRAVVEYFDPSQCVLFGSSFGGAVVLHHAVGDDCVSAVATRAPVTDPTALSEYRDAVAASGEHRFDTGEVLDDRFFTALSEYDFEQCLRDITVPVALFHGAADDSVPVEDTLTAAGRLSVDVLVQTFAGEGHRFSDAAETRLQDLLFAWLQTLPSQ